MDRFTRDNPCTVCGGWDSMKRSIGRRCFGFVSGDGKYAHCTRVEFGQNIELNEKTNTYPHLLSGQCRCGVRHTAAMHATIEDVPTKRRLVAKYSYRDQDGVLLSQVLRFEPRRFSQRRPDGDGGWISNLDGVARVLYRYPELLAANPDRWVYVVEGEKDVESLAKAGLLATTNPGGARR